MDEVKGYYFISGLGDIIRVCYCTDSYYSLDEITEKTNVVLASSNDYTTELFKWHKNRHLIHLHNASYIWERNKALYEKEYRGGDLEKFLGIKSIHSPFDINKPRDVTFYAADDIDSKDHIVFHPFAGARPRCLPEILVKRIVSELGKTNKICYVIGRDYKRKDKNGNYSHSSENLVDKLPSNVIFLNDLSVPATLNLIKNCSLFIGTHSSLSQAAGLEKKTSCILYPKNNGEYLPENLGKAYTFFGKLPQFKLIPITETAGNDFTNWLETIKL